ncbi:MAG TPA: hypothetical protein VFE51_19280 [Verrucomicrobiae bacterium]|nr:hypothetical protein [Verrucomicrobiae bacterium]
MKRGFEVWVVLCCLWLWAPGCSRPVPENALIVTQVPHDAESTASANLLDFRYPQGSRVVLATGTDYKNIRLLSSGLAAAGEPVISYDGRRIVFSGKSSPGADWQIYENTPDGVHPKALTAVKGGAVNPALLGDGTLLYVSPAPTAGTVVAKPSLFAQSSGARARQLTFGMAVSDPTVLSDGRILFVSPGAGKPDAGSSLYTINNDGTELTAFACQHDRPAWLRRPRELDDGRIAFLAGNDSSFRDADAEFVLTAHPFSSRARLLSSSTARISSIDLVRNGDWLVCAQTGPERGILPGCVVFQANPAAAGLERPALRDPAWACIEAVPAGAGRRPMGRLSNVAPSQKTGQILCLNANDTSLGSETESHCTQAKRIRVFTNGSSGNERLLGEVEVQSDGSFMAEVPADMPLGFEVVDEQGTVLRREPPLIWVRPGENRSCIGCHEAHNHSPRNLRPLAVRVPVPRLLPVPEKLAQTSR